MIACFFLFFRWFYDGMHKVKILVYWLNAH